MWCGGARDELGDSTYRGGSMRRQPRIGASGTWADVAFLGCLGDDASPVA